LIIIKYIIHEKGAYAKVFKVLLPKKGNFIAVKVIKSIKDKGTDENCAEQLKCLRLLNNLYEFH
jgi:trans-2-enoyl-CoA reductase